MNRRDVLKLFGVSAVGLAASKFLFDKIKPTYNINIDYPGLKFGHKMRDLKLSDNISIKTIHDSDILIIGSGIAALTSAWKLCKENYKGKITLLVGPELFGNSSSTVMNGKNYPTGAHYLPLQNESAIHTRELLGFFGIIKGDPYLESPEYNESDLVFSPMERFLVDREWVDGNHQHLDCFIVFSNFIDKYKSKIGSDGLPLFTFPIEKSSNDLRHLQSIVFSDFLKVNGFVNPDLLHYINYCIRDDYGVDISQVCAWAGLLYFAGRNGKGKNIDFDTVMTWESGNSHLAALLFNYIKDKVNVVEGVAISVENSLTKYIDSNDSICGINTNKTIVATPLMISARIIRNYPILSKYIPSYSSWVIANYNFSTLPREIYKGISLAYDNTINNSEGLGFVFSSNQSLDIDRDNKVLTTYTNVPSHDFYETRKMLLSLSSRDLFNITSKDLVKAYGEDFYTNLKDVTITVRGHAMPHPRLNFLSQNMQLKSDLLELEKRNIYLAHSDLSMVSVFEEASYHGYNAATKILNTDLL